MGFERTKFGNGLAAGAAGSTVVQDVSTHFGQRDFGDVSGVIKTEGAINELTFDLDADVLKGKGFPIVQSMIPAGSRVRLALVEVEEAFTLAGTTPAVSIGTKGSEAANGLDISKAQLEAVGVYDVSSTLAGTWHATTGVGLLAKTDVGIILTGTTPSVTGTKGKARVVVQYFRV